MLPTASAMRPSAAGDGIVTSGRHLRRLSDRRARPCHWRRAAPTRCRTPRRATRRRRADGDRRDPRRCSLASIRTTVPLAAIARSRRRRRRRRRRAERHRQHGVRRQARERESRRAGAAATAAPPAMRSARLPAVPPDCRQCQTEHRGKNRLPNHAEASYLTTLAWRAMACTAEASSRGDRRCRRCHRLLRRCGHRAARVGPSRQSGPSAPPAAAAPPLKAPTCSRRRFARCSPPTALPATANRRWPACAWTRAKGCCAAARAGRSSCPAIPTRARCSRSCSTPRAFPRMPRGRAKLPAADIDALAEWIRAGAVWPASADAPPAPVAVARARHHAGAARVLVVPAASQSRPLPTCETRPGRAPTSIASSSRVSSAKGWRRSAPPTS